MNYQRPELISALASQYVLGTLRGKARDRFESLKFGSASIQQEVSFWEAQLNPMSLALPPIQPDDSVWKGIAARLAFESLTDSTANVISISTAKTPTTESEPEKRTTTQPSRFWQLLSGGALAAAIVLAVMLVRTTFTPDMVSPVQSIAVIADAQAQTLWSIDIEDKAIVVKTTRNVPQLPNNDYQLWIVPANGEAPISLGVMQQNGEYRLIKPDIFDKIEIAAIAVSKEPKGGSPTGAPTEVLFAAELVAI